MNNKFLKIGLFLFIAATVLSSCSKDDVNSVVQKEIPVIENSIFVNNYGGYTGQKTTISMLNDLTGVAVNGYFTTLNGAQMISNAQSAYPYKGKVYFMGNNVDQVYYVDSAFKQTTNGVTGNLVKPRYCAGYGDYLYISCWGGDVWTDPTTSYIAKYNINTDQVESTIALHGGPEGVEISNGKLYAALNYDTNIAVIDLSTEAISYIPTKAVAKDVIKDSDGNIYVTYVSTYSNYSMYTGVAHINTTSDTIAEYPLEGVGVSDASVLALNKDNSKLYVVTGGHYVKQADGSYEQAKGAVSVFDVSSKKFDSKPFVEGLSGLNGIEVNQNNDNIYLLISPSPTVTGSVCTYLSTGTKIKETGVGISPNMMFTLD